MKLFIRLGFIFWLALFHYANAQVTKQKPKAKHIEANYSLTGNLILSASLQKEPWLSIAQTKSKSNKGQVLLIIDTARQILKNNVNETEKTVRLLNDEAYDVVILKFPNANRLQKDNLTLKNLLIAFRLVKNHSEKLGLTKSNNLNFISFGNAGNEVAKLLQVLPTEEQPQRTIFISPKNLNETISGTVIPALLPPLDPKTELLALFNAQDDPTSIAACTLYIKTWVGYGGQASLSTYKKENQGLITSIRNFIDAPIKSLVSNINPAAVATEGYSKARHEQKRQLVAKEKFDLIMMGNSITNNFEKPEYQEVWNQFFKPRKALNLGFSGYRTENILWNIENGELDGQSPKVIVLEIGTNNVDEKNYPRRDNAIQLAGGVEAIVKLLRKKLPETKIIMLRCFPGSYDGQLPTSHRAILERASDIFSKIADDKNIFYCDVNHVFLNLDGSINHEMMGDWLHPTPKGAKAWAKAMEPLLSKLMGDQSLDQDIPLNTAIVPVTKLEEDSYNWWDRHAEVLSIKDSVAPEIVLIGNSITHFWGGLPKIKYASGKPRVANGAQSWAKLFNPYRVLNLGFGWDRTQNALWRLDHGEIDGLHPKIVIIDIGTNNTSETPNARMNTPEEIVEGIGAVCAHVRSKVPQAKIVVMAIFPREKDPNSPRRILINQINQKLKLFTEANKIMLIDIGKHMLAPDGTFLPNTMLDFTHPTDKGYQVWADAIRPIIEITLYK